MAQFSQRRRVFSCYLRRRHTLTSHSVTGSSRHRRSLWCRACSQLHLSLWTRVQGCDFHLGRLYAGDEYPFTTARLTLLRPCMCTFVDDHQQSMYQMRPTCGLVRTSTSCLSKCVCALVERTEVLRRQMATLRTSALRESLSSDQRAPERRRWRRFLSTMLSEWASLVRPYLSTLTQQRHVEDQV